MTIKSYAHALRALLLALMLGACSQAGASSRSTSATSASCSGTAASREEVEPLFRRYCVTCHSPDGSAGEEHDFTRFEVLRAQRRRVKAVLAASAMPPRGLPQPADAERALMIRWACSSG